MSLEHYHSVLKNAYLKRKENKRLDNLLNVLIVMGRQDAKLRFQKIAKNSYSFRDKEVETRHESGLKIPYSLVTPLAVLGSWTVQSEIGGLEYTVRVVGPCLEARCLPCRQCMVCRHMMTCTCNDYKYRATVCKHMHACIIFYPQSISSLPKPNIPEELRNLIEYFKTEAPYIPSLINQMRTFVQEEVLRTPHRKITYSQPANKNQTPQKRYVTKRITTVPSQQVIVISDSDSDSD